MRKFEKGMDMMLKGRKLLKGKTSVIVGKKWIDNKK